jgi:hypothetical protein
VEQLPVRLTTRDLEWDAVSRDRGRLLLLLRGWTSSGLWAVTSTSPARAETWEISLVSSVAVEEGGEGGGARLLRLTASTSGLLLVALDPSGSINRRRLVRDTGWERMGQLA